MPLKRNQSAITQIEVTMVEIDRLFDLPPGHLLTTDSSGKAAVIFDSGEALVLSTPSRRARFIDEQGEEITGSKKILPGVYRGVRVSGYAPFPRSFARDESGPIKSKYVYVWSADPRSGSVVELEHELCFDENGQFQFVPFDSPANKGKDERKPEGDKRSRLLLDVLSYWKADQCREGYFFYLAPYQLPWAALQAFAKQVPARAVRLWDWFHTDIYSTSDPGGARPLDRAVPGGKAPEKMMFRLHLPDPFKEAVIRSDRYNFALKAWMREQRRLGSDNKYLLAKRLETFVSINPDLASKLKYDHTEYLLDTQRDSSRLLTLLMLTCANLLRWIGEKQQRSCCSLAGGSAVSSTWLTDGKKAGCLRESGFPDDWSSPFSQACDDYMEAPDAVWINVLRVISAVHTGLDESAPGRYWLSEVFEDYVVRKNPRIEHGGESYLWECKRKGLFQTTSGMAAGLMKYQAPNWVRQYRRNALSSLKSWMKANHDVDLELLPRADYRRVKSIQTRNFNRAKRAGAGSLSIEPDSVQNLRVVNNTLSFVALAVEAVNLNDAISAMGEEKDPAKNLALAGAAIDAYCALAEAIPKVPKLELPFQYGTKVLKTSPLAVASGVIDTVLSGMDLSKARTMEENFGHTLRFVGCILSTGAGMAMETGVGGWVAVILMVGGLALQGAGSLVVAYLSAASKFLRHCLWGTGGYVDFGDEIDEYWYRGSLSKLHDDIDAQHRCLDNLIFDYRPELSRETETKSVMGSSISILGKLIDKPDLHLIGPDATWQVQAEILRSDSSVVPETKTFPNEFYDSIDLTHGDTFLIKVFPYETKSDWNRAEGKIEVHLTAKLDVFGNGRAIVERSVEETFYLWARSPL